MTLRTIIISQARMGSSRLPGKVMKSILGKTVLEYHLERLEAVTNADMVGVATTTEKRDDVIENFCQKKSIPCFRGSEQDVLSRYHAAARHWQADVVVRVTSDTPLLEPEVITRLIDAVKNSPPHCDYAANFHHKARTFPIGMEAEVMRFSALDMAHHNAVDPAEREHVTPYIWKRPEDFALRIFCRKESISHLRWTVDTPEDFQLVSNILSELYPQKHDFRIPDVLNLLALHPEWSAINADMHHKYLNLEIPGLKQEPI